VRMPQAAGLFFFFLYVLFADDIAFKRHDILYLRGDRLGKNYPVDAKKASMLETT
jgi:hypothetical protein